MKNTHGWMIWGALALCAAMVLGAMGWLSHRVISADRDRFEADAKADLEERTRLALWRMDALGASIIQRENLVPWTYYIGVYVEYQPTEPGVLLHFDISQGNLRIPERLIREPHGDYTADFEFPERKEQDRRLRELLAANDASSLFTQAAKEGESTWQAVPKSALQEQNWNITNRATVQSDQLRREERYQNFSNVAERAQRANAVARSANQYGSQTDPPAAPFQPQGLSFSRAIETMPMRPVRLDGELFLLRQVKWERTAASGVPTDTDWGIQGVWLDTPGLTRLFLAEISDLLPSAQLLPAEGQTAVLDPLTMVSFPFKLIRGESTTPPPTASASLWSTPLRVAWSAVGLAILASALLVLGVMRLSERRASFVSAVTHELRTPLTTFQLYSDMLQSGAVKEEKRGEYFRTLHREADRLSHLVENVLAFSRIERGSARATTAEQTAARLIGPMLPRFAERLESTGLSLRADLSDAPWQTVVKADAAAVEHVLFNLIDNAAKYASATSPPEVSLEASVSGRILEIRVRDHGPGIATTERKQIFRAFHKSAAAAAESRPGVGLGLSLSRRLARVGGGELELIDTASGACFALQLPITAIRKRSPTQPDGEQSIHNP